MKKLYKLPALAMFGVLCVLNTSCGDDDSGSSNDFIDQTLQGTINGTTFSHDKGFVEDLIVDGESQLSFYLYDIKEEVGVACDDPKLNSEVAVFFSIPNKVGLYELFPFDIEKDDQQIVTLADPSASLFVNAFEGAVEILSITEAQVTGRIIARFDGKNTINGNFTTIFCPMN